MDLAAKAAEWNQIQADLTLRIVPTDKLDFTTPAFPPQSGFVQSAQLVGGHARKTAEAQTTFGPELRYIAGLDVSFFEGTDEAIGCIVVMEAPSLKIVYADYQTVMLDLPYIPSYLAFRESPVLLALLHKLKQDRSDLYPQIIMIDGNGALHPRMCGLACHVGVLADVPSIGVGKNFLQIDGEGLTMKKVKELAKMHLTDAGKWFPLVGTSGKVYGAALRPTKGAPNPIFVSRGHRVSLETAVELVAWCCRYRVPEPIRAADLTSREVVKRTLRERGGK